MDKKENQNATELSTTVKRGKDTLNCNVYTTNTQVFIYFNGQLIGSAGVKRPSDFDYDALLFIAKQGVTIEK